MADQQKVLLSSTHFVLGEAWICLCGVSHQHGKYIIPLNDLLGGDVPKPKWVGDTLEIAPTLCGTDHSLSIYAVYVEGMDIKDDSCLEVVLETESGIKGRAILSSDCMGEIVAVRPQSKEQPYYQAKVESYYLPSDHNLIWLSLRVLSSVDAGL